MIARTTGWMIARRRRLSVRREVVHYVRDAERRESIQLEKLNDCWRALRERPELFRAYFGDASGLPDHYQSFNEYSSKVPVSAKGVLRNVAREAFSLYPGSKTASTGGSTSEPLRFPVSPADLKVALANEWLGRSLVGLRPGDRCWKIWGHADTLANPRTAGLRRLARRYKDEILNVRRVSAYDLSEAGLTAAWASLVDWRPAFVYGYARSVDCLARLALARQWKPPQGLKAVIVSSESLPFPDSVDLIEAAYGCKLHREYGCVECGPIAHTTPEGGYAVFWQSFYLETVCDGDGRAELLITTLTPRLFPLFRYRIGDWIKGGDDCRGLTRIAEIAGRSNQVITIGGKTIHPELFTHLVKAFPAIIAFQVDLSGADPVLRVQCGGELGYASQGELRRRCVAADPALTELVIEQAVQLKKAPSGKQLIVVPRLQHDEDQRLT